MNPLELALRTTLRGNKNDPVWPLALFIFDMLYVAESILEFNEGKVKCIRYLINRGYSFIGSYTLVDNLLKFKDSNEDFNID
jgi:hypothetical protein